MTRTIIRIALMLACTAVLGTAAMASASASGPGYTVQHPVMIAPYHGYGENIITAYVPLCPSGSGYATLVVFRSDGMTQAVHGHFRGGRVLFATWYDRAQAGWWHTWRLAQLCAGGKWRYRYGYAIRWLVRSP